MKMVKGFNIMSCGRHSNKLVVSAIITPKILNTFEEVFDYLIAETVRLRREKGYSKEIKKLEKLRKSIGDFIGPLMCPLCLDYEGCEDRLEAELEKIKEECIKHEIKIV